jgi:hypothetical protein
MKTDDEIKEDWKRLETENLEKACEYLRRQESDVEDYMAEVVAALCNIDIKDMLSETSVAYIAQPRWLYWYALRYLTNETYEKIAVRTETKCGYRFTPNGIGQSINKMAALINREPLWMKRWTIIKHIIKLRDTNAVHAETVTMRVIAPKGIKVELKTE